jgi:hypothetical protein
MSKVKELLEFLEYEAHSLTASEFCGMLDNKNIPWVWDDCENILDSDEGRCVIEIIELSRMYRFEDGSFVEEIEIVNK